MARSPYVWGIDIGKCALKAVRCRDSAEPGKITAEAFDYVEYPMILSQPEADPVELVRAALQEFVGRNKLQGDRVAVSVPGQSGLSKFIKLPPIEAKKIPDIVRYEARQQIPFPLEQVEWDWQRLVGGLEEGGFVLDAEVGLFAMKKEQVAKALVPLTEAGIEVDILQLSPMALLNMLVFDQMPDPTTIDPLEPPPSVVLVSMGVDATDLVITNGLRIWQRSMPIGGNNFTKALVQGLKLTFAKAEQLKRNAARADNAKDVFNAMKPVFNEFASELQRSLNYFTGSDRSARIGKILLLGNASKLKGLADFVGKQLNVEVQRFDTYRCLEGADVTSAPTFKENRLAFGTAYGLALQGVREASINTNLLPGEIVRERLIESKKPWAVGAMVGLLGASALSFLGTFFAWTTYSPELYANAFREADSAKSRSAAAITSLAETKRKQEEAVAQQQYLVRLADRRFQSIDLLRAVETLLPHDEPGKLIPNPAERNEIHVDGLDCQWYPDLAVWFEKVKPQWLETFPADEVEEEEEGAPAADPAAAAPEGGEAPAPVAKWTAAGDAGPKGPGWVVQVSGHHYHNDAAQKPLVEMQFVRETLADGLLGRLEDVPVAAGPLAGKLVPPADLGIGYPVIVSSPPISIERVAGLVLPGAEGANETPAAGPATGNATGFPPGGSGGSPTMRPPGSMGPGSMGPGSMGPGMMPPGMMGSGGMGGAADGTPLRRQDFILQFTWQPVVPGAPKLAAEGDAAAGTTGN
ncbi:MAG: type IV pilus assembly protein PilM [Planctomycetota bacterium]|nr:MAG: type IV pilus assembly protein PilM [Planctomycetota bacterium]